MDRITEKIEYLIEKCPDKIVELAKKMYKEDPEIIERMLDYPEDAERITSRRKYDELVERIKWADNNGRGAKWSFEDIKKNSRIDFSNVDYTEYDFAYLVNMLYAKCCKYISDPSVYLKFAKCLLEDRDEDTKIYRGAYANKQKYKQRGEQDYYSDYNEENRRHRHYRNERMGDYENRRFDDSYDNRYYEDNRENNRRYRNNYEGFFRDV